LQTDWQGNGAGQTPFPQNSFNFPSEAELKF